MRRSPPRRRALVATLRRRPHRSGSAITIAPPGFTTLTISVRAADGSTRCWNVRSAQAPSKALDLKGRSWASATTASASRRRLPGMHRRVGDREARRSAVCRRRRAAPGEAFPAPGSTPSGRAGRRRRRSRVPALPVASPLVPGRRVVRPAAGDHRRDDLDVAQLLRIVERERVAVEHDEVGVPAGDERPAHALVV